MNIKKKVSTLTFLLCCSLTMSLFVACSDKNTITTQTNPSSSQTVSSKEKESQEDVSSQPSSNELKSISSNSLAKSSTTTSSESKVSSNITPKKTVAKKVTTPTKTTPSSKITSSQSPSSIAPSSSKPASSGTRPYLSIEDEILARVNNLRSSLGLNPLTKNSKLVKAATIRSDEMLATGQFSHTRPNGTSFETAINQVGYSWSHVGENIAYCNGYSSSKFADVFFDGWKNSPGHYKNMVDPKFSEIGIAISFDGSTAYATQNFGTQQ